MIELPDCLKAFQYENNFYLSSEVNRMATVMAHYDLFKQTVDIPGAIVECGVFKGASLVGFAAFRSFLLNPRIKSDRVDARELGKPSGRNAAGCKLPKQLFPALTRNAHPASRVRL